MTGSNRFCWNGANCWYLANGRCWYRHSGDSLQCALKNCGIVGDRKATEEMRKNADEAIRIAGEMKAAYNKEGAEDKRKVAERKKRAEVRKRKAKEKRKEKKIAEEKRKAKEKVIADEACSRISDLPGELKIYILHHFSVKFLQRLDLPTSLLRLILQAEEPVGSEELVKSTWLPRIHTNEDRLALFRMAEQADLVPTCPVLKPSLYRHSCSTFCPWFAPRGGWDAMYEKYYEPEFFSDGDDSDGFDFEEEEGFGFALEFNLILALINAYL